MTLRLPAFKNLQIVEFGIRELIRHSMTKNMTDMKYTTLSVDTKTIKILNTIQGA